MKRIAIRLPPWYNDNNTETGASVNIRVYVPFIMDKERAVMREIIDFSGGWLLNAENKELDKKYDESVIRLPFIHAASAFTDLVFTNRFSAQAPLAGKTLYLEFRQISGEVRVFNGETLLCERSGMATSFRVRLTDEAAAGDAFDLRVEVKPRERSDGTFIFGRVSVVAVGKSHFDMDDAGGPGLTITTALTEDAGELHVRATVVNPNNYDVVSFSVENAAGVTVGTRTEKPTGADTVITVPHPDLWGGQKDAHLYVLKAALVRDTEVLDNVAIPFGFRRFEIREDRFFRVNGLKLPLNGLALSDSSHLKTDKVLLEMIDANTIAVDSLADKTDLLYECDRSGTVVWYNMPYTGGEADFDELRAFLTQHRHHPSLAFVCCAEEADAAYAERFFAVCRECAPEVFTALRHAIADPAPLPQALPDVIAVTIRGASAEDDFTALRGRFEDLKNACPEGCFALFTGAPDGAALAEKELCEWHEKLWNVFCRDKSTIGFFAGNLTDRKNGDGPAGLVTYDRKYIKDAFWFYKSQFSAEAFVKLCCAGLETVGTKKTDVKCYTNTPPVSLTVNGNEKKPYKGEERFDGVYVFRKVALKKGVNAIKAAAGDRTDEMKITYEKK